MIHMGDVYKRIAAVESGIIVIAAVTALCIYDDREEARA